MQSNSPPPLHLGIIMDGNGRWARRRGLPRGSGHEAGVRAIRLVVDAAAAGGVGTLTLYAFSCDNWRRPKAEVGLLMRLLRSYLDAELDALVEADIRVSLVGRRDRLAPGLAERIEAAERISANGHRLHLRIAFDYSARDAILTAAAKAPPGLSRAEFAQLVTGDGAPDVDLLIRTGGERRLSDFLLWESAYAELLFVDLMWPDFGPDDLREALAEFRTRERRFGGLPEVVAA